MALTDPELDLLLEILEDDPEAEEFLDVGAELVRRARWPDAQRVLAAGLRTHGEPDGLRLLARATLELGDFRACLAAISRLGDRLDLDTHRVWILALERSGDIDGARQRAVAFLELEPDDVVVTSVLERLDAPPPDAEGRASDPFVTVERAERYVAVGRVDRAVRIYRRLLFHNPGDRSIAVRLAQLENEGAPAAPDDLSDELTDPRLVPPEFSMPSPGIGPPTSPATPSDPGGRRRRRSLIRR